MQDPRMQEWAKVLVNHSIGAKEGQLIQVIGEVGTRPLMEATEREILRRGAHPLMMPHFDTHLRGFNSGVPSIEEGRDGELDYIPKFFEAQFREVDGTIYVLGSDNPFAFAPYNAGMSRIRKANKPIQDVRLAKPWVITLFPTGAEAVLEGFPTLGAYEDFIIGASIQDYGAMQIAQEPLKQMIEEGKTVTLRTYDPVKDRVYTLEMSLEGTNIEVCAGKHNIPDGETYGSPNFKSVNGEVFLDVPILHNGSPIQGIYLRIKDGKFQEYRAVEGGQTLREIVETDQWCDQIGEFAIGTNAGVTRALKHPLFAEKIGGTIHMAIGKSYPERFDVMNADTPEGQAVLEELAAQGRYSKASQHVDVPKDFRHPHQGEGVWLGNKEIVWQDNLWVPK